MIESDSLKNVSHFGKKKKKRSFVQKQKRFGKRGDFGRGTKLSEDMYEYFMNIMKIANSNKEDAEEMSVLASNAVNEIKDQEAEYCCNQIVSRIMENLLPFLSDDEFSTFIEKFGENLRPLFCDSFGSHVLQKTLVVAYTKYKKLDGDSDNKLCIKFYDYIIRVSNFLINNLDEFLWNTYSNAIARTVFNVLSGNPVKGEIKLAKDTQEISEVSVPSEFKSIIKNCVKRLLMWPQFNDLCNRPITSGLMQHLLLASKGSTECSELVTKIIEFYKTSNLDLTLEENGPFARLVEVMLSVCDSSDHKKVYKVIFKKHLIDLAMSKSGNFAVQKLIINCQDEDIFKKIFDKIGPQMEEILKMEHSGVLLALVKGCRRLGLFQGECINMLLKTFEAKDTKDLVPLICPLKSKEGIDQEKSVVTLHGSLVVQELLNFKKPIGIVNSLLELPDAKLVSILCDGRGSYIMDEFVKSSTIGGKSRDRLFNKLRGNYVALAMSKFGSHSLDALWSVINVQQRAILAEELKAKQSELCSDLHGKGFARKIHLDNFRRNREEWMKLQKTAEATEKYFADIIPSKKRKKN